MLARYRRNDPLCRGAELRMLPSEARKACAGEGVYAAIPS